MAMSYLRSESNVWMNATSQPCWQCPDPTLGHTLLTACEKLVKTFAEVCVYVCACVHACVFVGQRMFKG